MLSQINEDVHENSTTKRNRFVHEWFMFNFYRKFKYFVGSTSSIF